VNKTACLAFLGWALPRLELDKQGYRRVWPQVCKRLVRRCEALGLAGFASYQRYLEAHPDEWPVLHDLCLVHISRFFRDRRVFEILRDEILPAIAHEARGHNRPVRIWSAGCAAGEEPYTMAMMWNLCLRPHFPELAFAVVATDVEEAALIRAATACYSGSSLKELPPSWQQQAFEPQGRLFQVRPEHRRPVEFHRQDLRTTMPPGPFDLVLCRNAVFTYFVPALRDAVARQLVDRLRPGGYVLVGAHERLDPESLGLLACPGHRELFRRPDAEVGGC
jgi:chemotaxis protein methyltransferase CheR